MPLGPVGRFTGRAAVGNQLRGVRRIRNGSIHALDEQVHIRTDGGDGALDLQPPILERRRSGLEHNNTLFLLELRLPETQVL